MKNKNYKVLITNPLSASGSIQTVAQKDSSNVYIVKPFEDVLEIYHNGKYLGECTSLSRVKKFIKRGHPQGSILIENPDQGYEMYHYRSPLDDLDDEREENPKKKKAKKKKAAKKKAGKKKAGKKKAGKKKAGKKKAGKKRSSKRKLNPKKAASANPKKVSAAAKKRSRKKSTQSAAKSGAEKVKKISIDSAVRSHVTKTTGKRPVW